MRRTWPLLVLCVAALEVLSLTGGVHVSTGAPAIEGTPVAPPSLKTVPVPLPEQLGDFVRDKQAAIALGKALFWDTQAGSDGLVACASCHFQAGADTRITNQVNPGSDGAFDVGRPNHTFALGDFPFHQFADPENRASSVIRSRNDVGGSAGVHGATFNDIRLGSARDNLTPLTPDPLGFTVGGLNVRRVTGRNTPPAINAIFNIRNFWDGRANRRFNGRNPFGDADPDARVLRVNDLGGLERVHVSIDHASTASQAVGPPLSGVEMSGAGRTWLALGKKMLSLKPLANQAVRNDDSVLGPYAISGGKGLSTTYTDLIKAAFQPRWWDSKALVDANLNVIGSLARDGKVTTTRYTVMEANFSLFWGLAILCYESTLVSDDTPYDQFAEGNAGALTPQQRLGLKVFVKSGASCIACHAGPEFTGAAFTTRIDPARNEGVIERMIMGDHLPAVYDGGFYNIGVRKTADDIGLGALDPFGNPLSLARQEQLQPGSVQDNFMGPVDPAERIAADGAFKTPSLRNVELTGPYFHNGSVATLADVVEFYTRGGNFRDQNLHDLDPEIHRQADLAGHPMRQLALVAFLKALTDERVRWYKAPFDHPELTLNAGAPGSEISVLADPRIAGQAQDMRVTLPAIGRNGASTPLRPFLDAPLFDPAPVAAPEPTRSHVVFFAQDSLVVRTRDAQEGDLWSNGVLSVTGTNGLTLTGDLVAGGNASLNGVTTLFGSCLARGSLSLGASVVTTNAIVGGGVPYFVPLVMPSVPGDLPPGAATARATTIPPDVTVPAKGTLALAPGDYGALNVGTGGALTLSDGAYSFRGITLGPNATLFYDVNGQVEILPPDGADFPASPATKTTVTVVGDLSLGTGAMIWSGATNRSNRLQMTVGGATQTIVLPNRCELDATLLAPAARVRLAGGASLRGAVFARAIEVADGARFLPHIGPFDPLLDFTPPAPLAVAGNAAAVTIEETGMPAFALLQNTPNPFRPQTAVRFTLPEASEVSLDVFDIAGRTVKTLVRGPLEPGLHTLVWNGLNDAGRRLPAGVYLYRLVAGANRSEKKMILIN